MFLNEEDLRIKEELLRYYPNKNINGISKNKELTRRIAKRANQLNIERRAYIENLGFYYSKYNRSLKINEENIDEYLEILYPDKIIRGLTDILKKEQKLYHYIGKYCSEKGIDNIKYLNEKGYVINSYNVSSSYIYNFLVTKNKYNIELICRLRDSYNVKLAEIAQILNVSRQLIDKEIQKKMYISTFIDKEEYFEKEIIEIIKDLINNYKTEYKNDKIFIKFYWNINKNDIVILYKYKEKVKCIFKYDEIIDNMLRKKGYYKLKENDIILLKKIKECKSIEYYTTWNGYKDKVRINDKDIKNLISRNRNKYKMSEEQYYKLLGLNLYTKLDEIEDRVYKKLKENINKDGIIKLSTKDKDGRQTWKYNGLYKDIRLLGKNSLKEISEYYGLKYIRKVEKKNRK